MPIACSAGLRHFVLRGDQNIDLLVSRETLLAAPLDRSFLNPDMTNLPNRTPRTSSCLFRPERERRRWRGQNANGPCLGGRRGRPELESLARQRPPSLRQQSSDWPSSSSSSSSSPRSEPGLLPADLPM